MTAPGPDRDPQAGEDPQVGENSCPTCAGAGRTDGSTCATCGGEGTVPELVGDA